LLNLVESLANDIEQAQNSIQQLKVSSPYRRVTKFKLRLQLQPVRQWFF